GVAFKNFDLIKYLVSEVLASRKKQNKALFAFAPDVDASKFDKIVAGQRVQIMKKDADGKATLQLGTEVVAAADGSIAGLLGASPGASTAVPIMLDVLARCFPAKLAEWEPQLRRMIPSYGQQISADEQRVAATIAATSQALQLS
ncbi:MAG TPA: malate:quinone oxidoreductase, partial [Microbacteriaceae bacterium]|nr:malate:quinone oxidoreductase [Microbacteriaceae bacterium]